jgi:hypothetical protein
VGVAADARYTLDTEVEGLRREARFLEEWHDEATKTTIHVEADLVFLCEFAECNNVVLASVRKVDGGAYDLMEVSPEPLGGSPNAHHDCIRVTDNKCQFRQSQCISKLT